MAQPPAAYNQPLPNYLLAIEPIPVNGDPKPEGYPKAYFVGSTAPNNVEDNVVSTSDPKDSIEAIANFLKTQDNPEILIAIHGYNTALGEFASEGNECTQGKGVKGWYQDIRNHIAEQGINEKSGLVLIGYRWPSEQIKGRGNDTLAKKLQYASQSLPMALKLLAFLAIAVLGGLSVVSSATDLPGSVSFGVVGVILLILATVVISIVFTLFLLRIVGYFRDAYRANNFGVPDLVEFIRQLDQAVLKAWGSEEICEVHRIKMSFIGHSMGAFVVTNTVRILSDVFDSESIGNLDSTNQSKQPSPKIGHAFTLGRLVLVSPDIPAETIISGRANFLSSSLRRFEEAYLFSNEGDMALKLASTAANYSSYPSRTREGGYRLGNVVVRSPLPSPKKSPPQYGIVNVAFQDDALLDREREETQKPLFLEYLYILPSTSLMDRQYTLLNPGKNMPKDCGPTVLSELGQNPIAELFTVFDCTDYQETEPTSEAAAPRKVGILSHALGKHSLNFWDYVMLSFDFFTGKIDTHGGYFYCGEPVDPSGKQKQGAKPEARFSKYLIYGLASFGFQSLLLKDQTATQEERKLALQNLSNQCKEHGIQVLLSAQRYNQAISQPLQPITMMEKQKMC